ncbi:CoB--CoM heterodisulfide reductase iron-sulfur subunit A family protein [bacterium]|nr:CoB--CoM heterodisulfide reductase iron-sulfur subunit A family protein [bacterium]NCP09464.1 CoB--CoM heterodisulfide reductase iron-sulfur subunit A family protein [bacterium]OIP38159.1 MAG: hypothetical protein AUK25_13325 [Desulfobacteraceae bacterium CG2_30_51_40]
MAKKIPKGSVMVLGGGIAGIQASLSLAGAGYGVYLVERSHSLGGMIPNLHRIYPLCACCKLDSRIDACNQHPNIRILLDSTVDEISGTLGDMKASVTTDGRTSEIKAGAIVLATGIETFDPSGLEPYSYGRHPNVVTSVEYEQMQRPLGPEKGVVKRPSDGKEPRRIAWLQCVGSRDVNRCKVPYCSSVCCMYALKEAANTRDTSPETETTVFYMDMRTHGKGYENYLNNAVSKGVRLIRSRVHSVNQTADTGDVALSWAEENGTLNEEIFDMVVLSVGLKPSAQTLALAEKIGIELNPDHYVSSDPFNPVSTSVPGVFVCGGMAGPNDIGQSMGQASAAAAEIQRVLAPAPFAKPADYPQNNDLKLSPPKILVAYHLCGGMDEELGAEIEKIAEGFQNVAGVRRIDEAAVSSLVEAFKKTKANRILFASCTPSSHKPVVEEALKRSGVNPYLYDTVDLRVLDPSDVSNQLRDRIRMGVARASLVSPAALVSMKVEKRALVVGGGPAGLESALSLADAGYPVTLVERQEELGGNARHIKSTWQGGNVAQYLDGLIRKTKDHPGITVMTRAEVVSNHGSCGSFIAAVLKEGVRSEIRYGAGILAPGAETIVPAEYSYGKNSRIYLWSELFAKLDSAFIGKARNAVFIQCVGSREPQMPHCSNLCCSFALRSALDLKEQNPDLNIYILFREMRAFGERENLYRAAREKGIIFIRYDLNSKPAVHSAGRDEIITVTVQEPILGRPVTIEADFISLQSAIAPTGCRETAKVFNVELDPDGFLAEAPEKLRPLDTTMKGLFMAGLAVYPKDITESIAQARGAAARAAEILAQDEVQIGGLVAEVNSARCAECCTCVRTCPFGVPRIDYEKGAAYIDPALCRGCGMCVAECPGKAIVMSSMSDETLNGAPAVFFAAAAK